MKILHTADWHIGRCLYGKKRYEEHDLFLTWLLETIQQNKIDVLLVAGDIFDTTAPSHRAQGLYYQFLCKVAASTCRHIVIIAGNHDSPTFLNAPKELLRVLNVYVIGAITDDPEEEVIVLYNSKEQPQAIICAVPYLRDKDIRTLEPGETIDDKNAKLIEGVKNHYAKVCALAEERQSAFESAGYPQIPILAMGHLFTAGGKTVDGDGVRELYVGSLAHVGPDVFPSSIDYLALGHLHVPQCVGKAQHLRYSGSPLPMGFGEATQHKKVILIEWMSRTPIIQEIQVPCFQKLVRIVGNLEAIEEKIAGLKQEKTRAWLEVEYTGEKLINNLRELLDEALEGSDMEILKIKSRPVFERGMCASGENETLDDLNTLDVFTRFLGTREVPQEEREDLMIAYREIIQSLSEEDLHAE